MSGPAEHVGDNELAFFFQTNEPIPARPLLNFIAEVERIALLKRHLGPTAIVEITEVKTGTKLVRLTFNQKLAVAGLVLTAAGLAVAIAQLGLELADRIQQPSGRLAEAVAEMSLDHGVVHCTITTRDTQISISRDQMPALDTVIGKRAGLSAAQRPRRAPFPLDIDDAVNLSEMKAVPQADEAQMQRMESLSELQRPRDLRVYTVVGYLSAPGSTKNVVPRSSGQFRTQSGKIYIARGVDWDKGPYGDEPVVIRARIDGRDGQYTVLNVLDVFEPEEP